MTQDSGGRRVGLRSEDESSGSGAGARFSCVGRAAGGSEGLRWKQGKRRHGRAERASRAGARRGERARPTGARAASGSCGGATSTSTSTPDLVALPPDILGVALQRAPLREQVSVRAAERRAARLGLRVRLDHVATSV